MPAVSGSPTQVKTSASTAADLAGTPDDAFLDGDLASVTALWPNSTFRLRRTALGTTPDNVTSIATFSGNGYWEVFAAGGNALVFADIAALAAFNDAGLGDGAEVYVQTLRSHFVKLVETPPAGDGITIVPTASGDGAWYRTVESPSWGESATLYVASTGTVEGAGTLADPITFAELARRFAGAVNAISCTVYVLDDIPASDPITLVNLPPRSIVTVEGIPTVVGSVGCVVSAAQAVNRAGNLALEIEATTLPSTWTLLGYVGALLRFPGSKYCWAAKDLGGANKKCRLSAILNWGTGISDTPAVASAFEVLSIPNVDSGPVVRCTASYVSFRYLEFSTNYTGAIESLAVFDACKILDELVVQGAATVSFTTTSFFAVAAGRWANLSLLDSSTASMYGCVFSKPRAYIVTYSPLSTFQVLYDTLFLDGAATYTLGGRGLAQNVAVFDSATYAPLSVNTAGSLEIRDAVYGSGNTTPIVKLYAGSRGTYTDAAKLTATSTVVVVDLGVATTLAWGALPSFNVANGSGLVLNESIGY